MNEQPRSPNGPLGQLIRAMSRRIQALEMAFEDLQACAVYPDVGHVIISRTDWDRILHRTERHPDA